MADLSDASFTAVNNSEVTADAPHSEALMVKLGSNENNLDTRLVAAESSITTLETTKTGNVGATDIATGTYGVGDIAASAVTLTLTSGKAHIMLHCKPSATAPMNIYGSPSTMSIKRGSTVIAWFTLPGTTGGGADHQDGFSIVDNTSGTGSVTYKLSVLNSTVLENARLSVVEIG